MSSALRAAAGRARRLVDLVAARPYLGVAAVALAARLVFAVASFVANPRVLIPDEQQYIDLAATVAGGEPAESWFQFYGQSLYDSTWVFTAPLRLLFDVFGTTRIVGQLWSVAAGVLTAVLVVRLVMPAVDRRAAVTAGLAAALLPSQVLWSSVVLREALVWLFLAVVALASCEASTGRGRRAVVAFVGAFVALVGLGYLRDQTMLAATVAVALAVPIAAQDRRGRRFVAVLAVAALAPFVSGAGLFGIDLLAERIPALGRLRANLASDAQSAFTGTTLPTSTTSIFVPGAPGGEEQRPFIRIPVTFAPGPGGPGGPVPTTTPVPTTVPTTTTTATTVPDLEPGQVAIVSRTGTVFIVEESAGANLRNMPRGAVAVLLRPFPWEQSEASLPLRFAAVENVLWYATYGLAVVGVVAGRRRSVLAFPALAAVTIAGVAFLTQGNLGTAFRHRGQLFVLLVVPAAVGAEHVRNRLKLRRPGAQPEAAAR